MLAPQCPMRTFFAPKMAVKGRDAFGVNDHLGDLDTQARVLFLVRVIHE